MKNIKSFIVFLFLAIGIAGCNFYEGKNIDPDAPTAVNPDGLLKGIQLADIEVQLGQTQRILGMWTGQYRGVQLLYLSLHEYNISAVESNEAWNLTYQSVVKQSRIMREGLKDDPFYQGVGKIMEAHALGSLAAVYGDIPFSEIAQDEKFPNPKFESQRSVYDGIQTMLNEAIVDLKKITGTRTVASDLLFKGAYSKWIEVAYTLKGRYYMETKEYDKAYTASLTGISSGANSLKFIPPGTAIGDGNLMNMMIANRGGYFSTGTTYLTRILGRTNAAGSRNNTKTIEDARSKYYAIPGTSSTTERGVAAQKAPMPLVIFEENLLNLAESGLRTKGVTEGLLQLNKLRAYLNVKGNAFTPLATTDTVKYDPYVDADFLVGGIENKSNFTQERALLREIIEERYVSLYGQILPFNDFRRLAKSESDVRPPIPFNTPIATKYPERLIYAQSEINANPFMPKPIPDIYQVTEVNK
ncbi:SusD/RagB family nutrient-binding outer membrane lipoprotein [Emticicia sp.]|uniref:SusD/RagB family nutrient-binding outer membrane lipoprotein n=1 Tax=Emticicia sp. TaxID=1930953 RepID=UPI003753CE15